MKLVLSAVAGAFASCSFVQGVVLGGSRSTATADETSDIDIGLYYDKDSLDYGRLNELAAELDDAHRKNLISREGEWGPWVNCGGWLIVNGYPVDIILRDMKRVKDIVQRTERGEFSVHYQTGHPHAYVDAAYRGELACSRILYSSGHAFTELKKLPSLTRLH